MCMHSVLDTEISMSASFRDPAAMEVTLAVASSVDSSIKAASSAYPRVWTRNIFLRRRQHVIRRRGHKFRRREQKFDVEGKNLRRKQCIFLRRGEIVDIDGKTIDVEDKYDVEGSNLV